MRKTDRSAVAEIAEQLFGGQTMVERLRRVLVRSPDPRSLERWHEFGWRDAPDPKRLLAEHEQFCQRLADAGADVVYGRSSVEADPDAIYAHDVSLISDEGAIVLRPGKELRRVEMAAATQFTVQAALQKWLNNYIKVQSVLATSNEGTLTVSVSYSLLNTDVPQVQTFVYGGNP